MIPLGVMGSARRGSAASPVEAVLGDVQMTAATSYPYFYMNAADPSESRELIAVVSAAALDGEVVEFVQCIINSVIFAELDFHSPIGQYSSAVFRAAVPTGLYADVDLTLSSQCDGLTVALWSVPTPVAFHSGQHTTTEPFDIAGVTMGPTPDGGVILAQTFVEGAFTTFYWDPPMVEASQTGYSGFLASDASCGTNGAAVNVAAFADPIGANALCAVAYGNQF